MVCMQRNTEHSPSKWVKFVEFENSLAVIVRVSISETNKRIVEEHYRHRQEHR